MFVTINPHSHLKSKIERVPEIEEVLKKYFTIHEKVFNDNLGKSEKKPLSCIDMDDKWIYIPNMLINSVSVYLISKGHMPYSNVKLDTTPHFNVKDSWYEMFAARDGQTEDFNAIIQKTHGVVQLPTGSGKSVFIIALADSLDEEGNILIIVPFNSIKEELIMRFKKIGTEIPAGFSTKSRINIINPTGYVNSNNFDNPACKEWMSKVRMVQIDECESITDSIDAVLNQVTSVKYMYGHSASADKFDGTMLKVKDTGLINLNASTYKIISKVGFSLVYKKPAKVLDFHVIKSTFYAKKLPFRNLPMEYRLSIKNIYSNPNFKICLKYVLGHKRDMVFVPINEIKIGEEIYKLTKELGYNPVLWHSGGVKSEIGLKSYADIKKEAPNGKLDLLVASKVAFAGIDISQLSDCLLISGTQYNSVIQPLGRCFRHDKPSLWLLEEMVPSKNGIYRNCHFKRMGIVKRTFDYKYISHDWDSVKDYYYGGKSSEVPAPACSPGS